MSENSNLVEVMLRHASADRADRGVHFWNTSSKSFDSVSYAELTQRSFAFGSRLRDSGHQAGHVCLIACHSPYANLIAFYGAISAGLVPMIFPMPRALGSHQALVERIRHWSSALGTPCVLVLEEGLEEKFHKEIPRGLGVVRLGESPLGVWDRRATPIAGASVASDDVAFYQTTSSSTGDHKAVAISHGNILSNVSGIRKAANMDSQEKMISWLPLFHDMGLVGAVLFSFCHAYPLYLMTPTQFIKRPLLWLKGMSEKRCTITTAPNFGYDYCARLVSEKDAGDLDLSAAKHFFIGAEPIRVSTIGDFCRRFAASGATPEKLRPAYGLAESTIITTISDANRPARFVYLARESIGLGKRVRTLNSRAFDRLDPEPDLGSADATVAVCTAGTAIEQMRVELVDEDGARLDSEGFAGEVVIRGESVALGYVSGDGGGSLSRFEMGQTHTGDMGVMLDGELFIIERIKNVIIRNGENFLVSAMEQKLAQLLGVSHENVAVFESDIHDPSSDIVVLVEKHQQLSEAQVDGLLASLPQESFPVDRFLLHRGRVIPRTTSGKKRHFYCRKLLLSQQLEYQQSIPVSADRIAQAASVTGRGPGGNGS